MQEAWRCGSSGEKKKTVESDVDEAWSSDEMGTDDDDGVTEVSSNGRRGESPILLPPKRSTTVWSEGKDEDDGSAKERTWYLQRSEKGKGIETGSNGDDEDRRRKKDWKTQDARIRPMVEAVGFELSTNGGSTFNVDKKESARPKRGELERKT